MIVRISVIALLVVGVTAAGAEPFPAREVWRVQTDTTATCLGSTWSEGGQPCFLIGATDRVLIVRNGDIIWTSPSLGATVTAVTRVDFGIGDGPEIIAGVETDSTGGLVEFHGAEYQDTTQFNLFGLEIDSSNGSGDTISVDNRQITQIAAFEDQTPDSSKYIILFDQVNSRDSNPDGLSTTTGRIIQFSLVSGEMVGSIASGSVAKALQLDWNGDGSNELVFLDYYEGSSFIMHGQEKHVFTVMDHNFNFLQRWETPEAYTYYLIGNTTPLAILPPSGDTSRVIAAYDWGDQFEIMYSALALFIPSQNQPQEIMPIQVGPIQDMCVARVADGGNWLICFDQGGYIQGQGGYIETAPADNPTDLYRYDRLFRSGIIRANAADYDNDGASELAILTRNGLFYYEIGDLSVPASHGPQLSVFSFQLLPPFPNPFNSSTTITYDVARPGFVRLGVYDALGRFVRMVSDGYQGPGSYKVQFSGEGLATGNYLLRLSSPKNEQSSRSITYIK